jgi:hypothetical protein
LSNFADVFCGMEKIDHLALRVLFRKRPANYRFDPIV